MENDNSEARACAYKWRQEGGQAMTLFERLLWELYHFRTTGQHAEFHRITLCAGTTDLTGNTFAVGWESDEAACWIWRWRMIDEDPAFAVADVLT
jgi:hypothetical protein